MVRPAEDVDHVAGVGRVAEVAKADAVDMDMMRGGQVEGRGPEAVAALHPDGLARRCAEGDRRLLVAGRPDQDVLLVLAGMDQHGVAAPAPGRRHGRCVRQASAVGEAAAGVVAGHRHVEGSRRRALGGRARSCPAGGAGARRSCLACVLDLVGGEAKFLGHARRARAEEVLRARLQSDQAGRMEGAGRGLDRVRAIGRFAVLEHSRDRRLRRPPLDGGRGVGGLVDANVLDRDRRLHRQAQVRADGRGMGPAARQRRVGPQGEVAPLGIGVAIADLRGDRRRVHAGRLLPGRQRRRTDGRRRETRACCLAPGAKALPSDHKPASVAASQTSRGPPPDVEDVAGDVARAAILQVAARRPGCRARGCGRKPGS